MTPIERAARQLVREDYYRHGHQPCKAIEAAVEVEWHNRVDDVRAVLAAIREPSVAMIDEAYESYKADGGSLRDVFMNMIDVALEEGS